MKRNRMIFLLLFLVICCSAVFLGCSSDKRLVGDTREEYEAAGYQKVTLYYNAGKEGSNTELTYFVKKGGRLPAPGYEIINEISAPLRAGYELIGWYEINVNKYLEREETLYDVYTVNGEVVKEARKNVKNEDAKQIVYYIDGHDHTNEELDQEPITMTDLENEAANTAIAADDRIFANYNSTDKEYQPWNFDFNKIEKDTVLVAMWSALRYYVLVPPENKNDDFDAEGYNKLTKFNISSTGAIFKPTENMVTKRKGYRAEGFYLDRVFKNEIDFDLTSRYTVGEPEYVDGSTEVFKIIPIYVKYIDEKYKIVNSASDIKSIDSNASYYIKKDLDFTGVTLSTPETYSGEIMGNGKVWRNLTMTVKQTIQKTPGKDTFGGIFKTLSGATISDITFENLTIRFERISTDLNNVDWSKVIEVNVFAKNIDASRTTVIRNIVLGSATNKVKLIMAQTVEEKIDTYNNIPVLHEDYGSIYIFYDNGADRGWMTQDENGVWPDYNYQMTYWGEYSYRATDVLYNGKALYGYQEVRIPEGTPEPRFVETIFSSVNENIVNCEIFIDTDENGDVKEAEDAPVWLAHYGPGLAAPTALGDYVQEGRTYHFAGWFRMVKHQAGVGDKVVEYYTYELQDVSFEASENMILYAMWTL